MRKPAMTTTAKPRPIVAQAKSSSSCGTTFLRSEEAEWPATRRFAVVTAPATAGFPEIEAALAAWARARQVDWYFGNVYNPDGSPLNWW